MGFYNGEKKLPTSTGWVRENRRPKQELQQDPLRGTSKAQRNLRVCLELHGHQQIVGPFWRYSQFQDFCWTCKKSHGTNAILWHCSVFTVKLLAVYQLGTRLFSQKKGTFGNFELWKALMIGTSSKNRVFPLGSDEFMINLPFHKHLQILRTIHNVIVKW